MNSLEEILANTKLDPATGCRVWLGGLVNGYGQVYWKGKCRRVHRVVWELAHGCSPGLLDVLHTCDNKPCCEPIHLFLGTQQDNIEDCIAKGRKAPGKLAEAQVAEIKRLLAAGETQERIASAYGVNQSAISHIALDKHWKHVPWPAKGETNPQIDLLG